MLELKRTQEERHHDEAERQAIGYETRALRALVPQLFHGGLHRYINGGTAPGGFLSAVLQNDLMSAVNRADEPERYIVPICHFLYNYTAAACYGSAEKYTRWLQVGGYRGYKRIGTATKLWSARLVNEGTSDAERTFFMDQDWKQSLDHRVIHGLDPEDAVEDLYTQLHKSWELVSRVKYA